MRDFTKHELKIINKTAKNLAPFFVFGYYDQEDIEQEIRLLCCTIIDGYDEGRSDLYTYLFMQARNYLIDMRRKKLSRAVQKCILNDRGECTVHANEKECNKHKARAITNKKKRGVCEPKSLSEENLTVQVDLDYELDKAYIFNIIDQEIPAKLRKDYLIFLEGGKITYYSKLLVLETIRAIAAKHGLDKLGDLYS